VFWDRLLARIEHKVDSIEQTSAFALRAEADKHFESVKKIFKNGRRRAQVYLAADGTKSVQEIADHLGMKRQNVGVELKLLSEDEGLLEISDCGGRGDIWCKKAVDRSLRITPFLCSEYDLTEDGLPARKSSRR
jgi:biotin operon repressor